MKTKLLIMLGILFLLSLVFISTVQALTVKSVHVFPSEVEPGETATIIINLENTLNEDVEDISVSLIFRELIRDSFGNVVSVNELPFAPYDSSNEASIDELGENDEEEVVFRIKSLNDAKSGIYKIPVRIVYYDEDGDERTKDSLISITVNAEPIIGVSIEEGLLLKSKENELIVKIINKGLSDVKFLELEVKGGGYYSILSPKNVYIGDIDSDDFDTANFKLYFKKTSPSTINLLVKVYYRDAINNEYSESFTLPLRVYTKKQAIQLGLLKKSKTTTYLGIIVVVIIIYIIYRKRKKRRKARKASS